MVKNRNDFIRLLAYSDKAQEIYGLYCFAKSKNDRDLQSLCEWQYTRKVDDVNIPTLSDYISIL